MVSNSSHTVFKFLAVNVNVNRAEFFVKKFWQILSGCFSVVFGLDNKFDPTSLDVLQSHLLTPVPDYFG